MGKTGLAVSGLMLLIACAPTEQTRLEAVLDAAALEGFAMSERKDVQPASGEATAGRASLSWEYAQGTLRYQITTQGSNACYGAGSVAHEVEAAPDAGPDVVVLRAEVTYSGGVCAQVVQEIRFEGEVPVTSDLFTVRAEVLDQRSGRTTVVE